MNGRRGRAKGGGGRWQQWQLVIVLMKARPPLSLLHILSCSLSVSFHSPFSLTLYLSLPLSISLSVAKNNEVTPLSRTVPYKNSLLSLIPSHAHSFLSTSRLPRDRPAPCRTLIRACTVSLTPLAHTKRFLSDPLCLNVNEKANSTALISLIVYTACALCYMCIYTSAYVRMY